MSKHNVISGGQLACLLIVTRLCSLMLITSVSLVEFCAELAFGALLSSAVWLLDRQGIQAQKLGAFAVLTLLFCALAVYDAATYMRFTQNIAHTEVPIAVIAVLLTVLPLYAGSLGCEAAARFSVLALLFVCLCVLVALLTNIAAVRQDFFLTQQSKSVSASSLIRCFDVPLLFAIFAPRTHSKKGRALLLGSVVPYAVSLAVILMCRAVLGKTARIYSSPIFALFQLGKAGSFTKLDIMYICTVLVLLFCKISVAVSAAKMLVKREIKG